MRTFSSVPAALAAAFLLAGASVLCAEPVKIRASWVVAPSDWAPLFPEKSDLMKNNGKSYAYEAVRFQGTPAVITALANNEIELGNLAFSSLAIAIQNAGLDDLRIVSDQFMDGVGAHYSNQFFVLADSPIRKVEDLKGKIVATNVVGSGVDVAMRVMLRKHGLEDKRDYTVVEAPFDPELKQIARPLFAQKDALGPTQMLVWAARASFLQKNRAAMVDFMEDAIRVVRWYLDPAHHDEATRYPRGSPSSVRSCLRVGCSPRRNMGATQISCRIWPHCSPTSMRSATWASSRARSTCRNTLT